MELLDGKAVSKQLRNELAEEVKIMVAAGRRPPHLAVILVGKNPASETYVNAKVKACKEAGYESSLLHFPPEISHP